MKAQTHPDVVLAGAGIMSATLGALLKQLQPGLTMEIFESLDFVAGESSNAWNNAGTGHAALCELNYTPQRADGSVDVSKAVEINESFEVSKQFWSYLVGAGLIASPDLFIRQVPHLSFVRGEENVDFLTKRYEELRKHHLFSSMEYSESPEVLAEWMPLVMEGRDKGEAVAATRALLGTDVNFGSLTRSMIEWLKPGGSHRSSLPQGPRAKSRRRWPLAIFVQSKGDGAKRTANAKFVFLGAGGGALPLLQKADIPEGKGFGGFPVSGQWLRCDKAEIVDRHNAKVYGKAAVGAPPMSVPHLDTRVIDGKRSLFFGPYAGFSTKFLKHGSAGPRGFGQARQSLSTAVGRKGQHRSHSIPHRPGAAIPERSSGGFEGICSDREKARLASGNCRPTGPNHQEGSGPWWNSSIWYRSGFLGRWIDGRAAGRVAWGLDLRLDHASTPSALF